MEFHEFKTRQKSEPGFVYVWVNNINGKRYIGSHKGTPDDGYVGSGKHFNRAVKKYGIENFTRRIVYRGAGYAAMETLIIKAHGALNDADFYNLSHISRYGTMISDETKAKLKECQNRPEVRAKISATNARPEVKARRSVSAKEAMNRPEVRAKHSASAKASHARPEVKEKRSASMKEANNRPEVRAKNSAAQTGKVMYNNGLINKWFKSDPGEGWVRGRVKL